METVQDQLRGSLAITPPRQEITVATPSANPSGILELAISKGAGIEQLTKLLELQERWEANEARKAFNAAMAAFKANPPKVHKHKAVAFKDTKYKHATLDDASELIGDALSRHGLSHRWDVQQRDNAISVSCVLTHELGHSERVTMQSLPDTSGSKNSIQAIGSAVTYLQRYTLFAATGIAPDGDDNDGKSEANKKMDRDEIDRYSGLISGAESLAILDAKYQAACADAGDDLEAKKEFKKLAGIRYKELGGQ